MAIIREIGVECGGSNVQFAVNPADGDVVVIEMNPRVSRSSALASKATGFPIAKMAAKLSVGYTLDRLPNDITKKTPASFEPSIDYVVTKVRGGERGRGGVGGCSVCVYGVCVCCRGVLAERKERSVFASVEGGH